VVLAVRRYTVCSDTLRGSRRYDFVSNLCPIHAKGFVVTSIYNMFAREGAHCP